MEGGESGRTPGALPALVATGLPAFGFGEAEGGGEPADRREPMAEWTVRL